MYIRTAYMYVHNYIYTYIILYVYTCICSTYMYQVRVYILVCMYIYTYIVMYVCMYVDVCAYMCINYMYVCFIVSYLNESNTSSIKRGASFVVCRVFYYGI